MSQSAKDPVSIPSVALARMALRLACHRIYCDANMANYILLEARGVHGPYTVNVEYYRIIDRLTRGEKP